MSIPPPVSPAPPSLPPVPPPSSLNLPQSPGAIMVPPPRSGGSGCGWLIGGSLGCVALILLIPLVLIVIGVTSVTSLLGGVGLILGVDLNPQSTGSVTIPRETVIRGVQPLGQLVSVSAELANPEIYIGIQQGAFNACGHGAHHVVQGSFSAGIDLTQIGDEDLVLDETRGIYVLTLPAPNLTNCAIDYIRQYDRTTTTCNIDWDEARLIANHVALTLMRDEAIERGLLDRAERETRIVLANFVSALTGRSVEIVFAERPEGSAGLPTTCIPAVPRGWQYNEQTRQWVKSNN